MSADDIEAFVDAFRSEVDMDVDVDAAWMRFENEVVPTRSRRLTLWVAGTVALVAALALAWLAAPSREAQVQRNGARHQARDQARPSPNEHAVPKAGIRKQRPVEGPAEPQVPPKDAPSKEPVADTESSEESPAAQPRPRPRRAQDTSPNDAEEPSRLAEELRMLEAMRAATKAGRHTEALELARAHAKAFGRDGPFGPERELTRVRALCGLGRIEDLMRAKARFATSFPSSHLGSLVRATCEESSKIESRPSEGGDKE